MKKTMIELLENRRSIYGLNKDVTLSDEQISSLVKEVVKLTPSAFHSQTQKAVVLLGEQHDRFWQMVFDAIKQIVPEEQLADSKGRIDSFGAAYGTVVFFEDMAGVKALQESFPIYKENFPIWSTQGSAMAQISLWNAFTENGIGASLQHYNELIETSFKEAFSIEDNWKMVAQMPFGGIVQQPDAKEFHPVEERVLVVG